MPTELLLTSHSRIFRHPYGSAKIKGINILVGLKTTKNVIDTLGCIMFGPFWSVWHKKALAEVGVTPMMMPCPCPSGSMLLKSLFKSHNFFIIMYEK